MKGDFKTYWHWSVGTLENLVISDNRGPLQRQADVSALLLVESGVYPVLEVRWKGYLRLFFLFPEHFRWIVDDGEVSCDLGSSSVVFGCHGNGTFYRVSLINLTSRNVTKLKETTRTKP